MVKIGVSELASVHQALQTWLLEHAYDLWWTRGADHARGGFHERLRLDATPTDEPRRARLHPRQMFAYGRAAELGWSGPAAVAVAHALRFFLSHYRRADGLFRTCVTPDGEPLDERAVLYDQAFALLGLAAAFATLGDDWHRSAAHELHDTLRARLAHPIAGFEESSPPVVPLTANSHMHLLEASLAWQEVDEDPCWRALAAQLVELALTRLIDPRSGALRELFTPDWQPVTGEQGEIIEPGHHFEWASLLLQYAVRNQDPRPVRAALRLIEIGETRGVDPARGVAVDAVTEKASAPGAQARLWPQTERLRAACIAAEVTGHEWYLRPALEATRTLLRYLDTPVRGLWRDRMSPRGSFLEEPAPASSFYHVVGAAAALARLVRIRPWLKTNK